MKHTGSTQGKASLPLEQGAAAAAAVEPEPEPGKYQKTIPDLIYDSKTMPDLSMYTMYRQCLT